MLARKDAAAPWLETIRAPMRRAETSEAYAAWLPNLFLADDGAVMLVRRPPSGLLGGMVALPETAPAEADWREAGAVDHVFTHFALRMRLLCARVAARPEGIWWPVDRIDEAGLPTLFAKLAARGAEWRRAA